MPIIEDLYNELLSDDNTSIFAVKLKPYVKGAFKFFNNYTNVEANNRLILFDIYDLNKENIAIGMLLAIELFLCKMKINRAEEKIIYLDEVWKLMRWLFK